MIKPTVFLKSAFRKKPQSITSAFTRLGLSDPAVLCSDAKRCQAKAGRRYAGNVAMIVIQRGAIHSGAVGYQTRLRIGLLPKIIEGTVLEVIEKELVLA